MNGYERIKELYLKMANKDKSLSQIVKYLMQQQNMNELYLNESKTLDAMMNFINDKAKEQAINNVAVIPDTEVYDWAILYFSKGDDELGLTKTATPIKAKPKEETKEEQKEDNAQLKLEI